MSFVAFIIIAKMAGAEMHAYRILTTLALTTLALVALAGCSAQPTGPRDPGPVQLAQGETCATIRAELDGLDRKGAPGFYQLRDSGKKLSADQEAIVSSYDTLLNRYLGARCHA